MELRWRYMMAQILVDAIAAALLLYYMIGVTDTKTIAGFILVLILIKAGAEKLGLHEELEKRIK